MWEYDEPPRYRWRGLGNMMYALIGSLIGGLLAIALVATGTVKLHTPLGSGPVTTPYAVDTKTPIASSDSPVVAIAAKAGPAVVGIINKAKPTDSHPWAAIGGGTGSGVIFDPKGYIVTNNHVVSGASSLEVDLADGRKFPAKVIGTDVRTDLAVLKIDADNLTTATFGDSDNLRVGELVVAIGNPLGEDYYGSVTAGILSATRRTVNVGEAQYIDLLQTDAAINPGNSGGALVNSRGEVIGINSVKISGNTVEGMGFAIPSYTVQKVIKDLVSKGKVSRPWLGVMLQEDVTTMPNPPKGVDYGVVIKVVDQGPAQKAGMKDGDIIQAVNGQQIRNFPDLQRAVFRSNIGDKLKITVSREGKQVQLTVTLDEMKNQ